MQCLLITGFATITTSGAIYLPYDKAAVPFGDPLGATLTAATPSVITVPGYVPASGDAVSISVAGTGNFLTSLAGLTSIQLQLNTTYYVVGTSISGGAFSLTTQKGGVAPATVQASITTLVGGGGNNQVFVHLLSSQPDGPTLPFKPNNTVLAMHNLNSGATVLNLYGSADLNTVLATGSYGAPLGPASWALITTVSAGLPKLVNLTYDWLAVAGGTATMILLQN
jgi:hypothetical protein